MKQLKKLDLNQKYDHKYISEGVVDFWLDTDYANQKSDFCLSDTKPFSVIMPPPNLTGKLHIGHAWNLSIQDLIVRYKKLVTGNINWIPGTDHAGIATQTKFESIQRSNNIDYKKDDRQTHFNNIYKWAQESSKTIKNQAKSLGLALNWKKEKFTLSEQSNKYVLDVFVKLYEQGYITKKYTLVNWDTKLNTAISNIEVINKETTQKLHYIKYYLEDSEDYLEIATTRPETIYADVAVFVNPNDERYLKYHDKKLINPLNNQLIPILVDEYIDIDFGSAVMKCTPGHDHNDYALSKKHNLPELSCINFDGTLNELALEFEGVDVYQARELIVDKLIKENKYVKFEEIVSNIGYSDRSNTIIQPLLSKQWFLITTKFVDEIKKLVNNPDNIKIYPKRFLDTINNWLDSNQDWCISRQLVWGHQIPAWYNKNNSEDIRVSITSPGEDYIRDPDVLDTWFSSALWPLICFNEGIDDKEFADNFPNSLLVTAYDIVFFWVLRMVIMSWLLKKSIPFKDLLLHGLILDDQNRKMSKSLNNGIDPIQVIDEYGSDALRLFLTSNTSPGEDVSYNTEKMNAAASFLNKLWNLARYISLIDVTKLTDEGLDSLDYWIINRFNDVNEGVQDKLKEYRFALSNKQLSDFIWDDFANVYIEFNKKNGWSKAKYDLANKMFRNLLVMLHPSVPFITEQLYNVFEFSNKKPSIILEKWPSLIDIKQKTSNFDNILGIVIKIRNFKQSFELKSKTELNVLYKNDVSYIEDLTKYLKTENINLIKISDQKLDDLFLIASDDNEFYVVYENDKSKIIDKLKAEIVKLQKEVERSLNIVNNENFKNKAPKEKYEAEVKKLNNYQEELKLKEDKLNSLK
ncbi:valine--tRNA ligase [Mycoplasma bradburyae]|uniref:valine--tRNA ligase n=1 Tax=Mycoplasma bradburyae TaxID=2963128 RepID=UPI0023424BAC|nr:valine--tRNA ligase [Mycoplasma bradburyae]MDC4183794.1 valine--tRNA ligase [Mycoplasma bradburyae]